VRKGLATSVIAAATALVALLAYAVVSQRTDTSIEDTVAAGDRIDTPETALPLLGANGERSIADYRGQVVVLNFWASWCPPCIDELPLLQRTQRRIAGRAATVLGVNYKDLSEDALRLVHRFGVSFPSLRDRDGEYADDFAVRGIPETFVVDRRGRIAAVRRGPVNERWLTRTVRPLLGERQ
jgi:cytochrome c biogenesis protein CcmG, thiol:disulfide interchange protein DsbE